VDFTTWLNASGISLEIAGFVVLLIAIKSILGQDLAHAIIRLLSYQLAQRVKKIDDFEKNNEGDLRHFTNSADISYHFDLGSEQEDDK
jgi:hypothetical protein